MVSFIVVLCFILISIASFSGSYATDLLDRSDNTVLVDIFNNTKYIEVGKGQPPLEPVNYPVYNLSFRLKTDNPSYSIGEVIQIGLLIRNNGEKSITLGSLDIGIMVPDSRLAGGIGVDITLAPTTILPQNEVEIGGILRWNTRNVVPGIYTIKVIIFSPIEATTEIGVEIER